MCFERGVFFYGVGTVDTLVLWIDFAWCLKHIFSEFVTISIRDIGPECCRKSNHLLTARSGLLPRGPALAANVFSTHARINSETSQEFYFTSRLRAGLPSSSTTHSQDGSHELVINFISLFGHPPCTIDT